MAGQGIISGCNALHAEQTQQEKDDGEQKFASDLEKKQVDQEDRNFVVCVSRMYWLHIV